MVLFYNPFALSICDTFAKWFFEELLFNSRRCQALQFKDSRKRSRKFIIKFNKILDVFLTITSLILGQFGPSHQSKVRTYRSVKPIHTEFGNEFFQLLMGLAVSGYRQNSFESAMEELVQPIDDRHPRRSLHHCCAESR